MREVMSVSGIRGIHTKFRRFGTFLSRDAQGRVQPLIKASLIGEVALLTGKTYATILSR